MANPNAVDAAPSAGPPTFRNRMLAALPADELARLTPLLERVELRRREVLFDPHVPVAHVYFVETGIASILSVLRDGSAVETATIGCEGMIGMPVFHGVDVSTEQAMMQVPGVGHRVRVEDFRALLPTLPTLYGLLHRFASFAFTFTAQNSACNRKHAVEQRLARWLLIVHDRMDTDDLALTHDFVSQMLGVRRASVTDTLTALEAAGLVSTGRNRITVVNRAGLLERVCECYAIIESASERILVGRGAPSPLDDVVTLEDGFSTVGDGAPQVESTDAPTGSA